MRRRWFVALGLAAVVLPSPAWAYTPPTPAPDTPPTFIDQVRAADVFAPTPREWVPRGTRIASSGFRTRDQVGYLNYTNSAQSFPNKVNHFYFDAPAKNPRNMTRADVYRVIGTSACIDEKLPCQLTLSAALWRKSTNAAMDGGHCWGFATTSAEVFNGDAGPNAVGTGPGGLVEAELNSKLTRQIARAWATQTLINLNQYAVSPVRAVEMLSSDLKRGSAPYVAAITSGNSGHAVLPTALYRRSGGRYDVSVYDNNFPGRIRAVQIDTQSNTFKYLLLNRIGDESAIATGKMYLVPIADLKTPLNCPLCKAGKTQVTIAPVPTAEPIAFSMTAPNGNTLSGLEINYPTSPIGFGGVQSFPQYSLPGNAEFALRIDGSKLTAPVVTDITLINRQASWTMRNVTINPGSQDIIYSKPRKGKLTYESSQGVNPAIQVIDGTGSTEWAFELDDVELAAGESATVTLNEARSRVILKTTAKRDIALNLLGVVDGARGAESVRATGAQLPVNGTIKINYRNFQPGRPQELLAVSESAEGARKRIFFEFAWIPL